MKGHWMVAVYGSLRAALGLVCFLLLLRLRAMWLSRSRPMHAAVVVLGDIGRSPRMMNHAVSLANAGMRCSFPLPRPQGYRLDILLHVARADHAANLCMHCGDVSATHARVI